MKAVFDALEKAKWFLLFSPAVVFLFTLSTSNLLNSRHEFRFTWAMCIGGLLAFASALGFATAWERRRKQAMRRQDDALLVIWFFVMFLGIVAVNIAVTFAGCAVVLR